METESGTFDGEIENYKVEDNRFAVLILDTWYSKFLTDYKGNKIAEVPEWLDYGVQVKMKWHKTDKGFYNIDSIAKTGVQGTIETTQGQPKTPKTSPAPKPPVGGMPKSTKQPMHPNDRHSIERQKSLDIANQMVMALIGDGVKIADIEKRVEELFQKYLKLIQNR